MSPTLPPVASCRGGATVGVHSVMPSPDPHLLCLLAAPTSPMVLTVATTPSALPTAPTSGSTRSVCHHTGVARDVRPLQLAVTFCGLNRPF